MKKSWGFMREHMPGVVQMLKDRRGQGQGAHVDACWVRGVQRGEPGWFFASEGGVHIGTLWPEAAASLMELRQAADLALQAARRVAVAQGRPEPMGVATMVPLLILRPEGEAPHGTD